MAGILAAIQRRREVVQGNRCGYCDATGPEFPDCCPPMKADVAKLEIVFWGTGEQRDELVKEWLRRWFEPQADTPAVVPSQESK